MKRRLLIPVCLLAPAVTLPAYGDDARLVEAKIVFNTYDGGNDKDANSKLKITVFSVFGSSGFVRVAAQNDWETYGRFADGTINPIVLRIQGTTSLVGLSDLKLKLEFEPNGDDTWKFSYDLSLKFSDGTVLSRQGPRTELSDKVRVLE